MIHIIPALALLVAVEASADTLSDDALVAYASQSFDKATAKGGVLGVHHGARIIVEFRCSDLCPDYTTRIIHYDVAPGPDCAKIGGVTRAQLVPVSIAAMRQDFCVPKVLADKKLF